MELERILQLSKTVLAQRARRDEIAGQLQTAEADLAKSVVALEQYVTSVSGNGNGSHRPAATPVEKAPPLKRKRRSAGYQKGSVAHRILLALDTLEGGLSGADLTAATGVENKQIHALLTRMVPAGHIRREAKPGDERGSLHFITDAGREALANSREGGSSDDAPSAAEND